MQPSTEFGVRGIVSTWALLDGLVAHAAHAAHPPLRLFCLDIDDIPEIAHVTQLAAACDVSLHFAQGNSATTPLPYDVDLLFIDTWHVYGHLKRELTLHAPHVRRFIALHDTEVDKVQGESMRMGYDIPAQVLEYG